MPGTDAPLYGPAPAAFEAETLNTYVVPLARPVMFAVVLFEVPSLTVVHVEPLFDEYWIM